MPDLKGKDPPWLKLVSDLKRQIKAFEVLTEQNPNLSPNLLIQNIRKILFCKDQSLTLENLEICNKSKSNEGQLHDQHGQIVSNWAHKVENFDEMNLDPLLLKGIREFGYVHPSDIQKRVIVPCVNGWDVIAQAPYETGRTSAVVIATLQRIQRDSPRCQALIVTLTPQSAKHILGLVEGLGAKMGISFQSSNSVTFDGKNVDNSEQKLNRGVQIFIGTLHEVNNLLRRRVIRSDDVQLLILDDADKLLSGNLKVEMHEVMDTLAMGTQIVLMATRIPHDVHEETKTFMRHPVCVWVKEEVKDEKEEHTLKGVWEFYIDVGSEEFKLPILDDMYDNLTETQTLVFCNSVEKVQWLTKMMMKNNRDVSAINGHLDKDERELILKNFAMGNIFMLIATDWLTVGLERTMTQIPLVINFDFPVHAKIYVPRNGLGRRFGLGRMTISLVADKDRRAFDSVQDLFGSKISELPENYTEYLQEP